MNSNETTPEKAEIINRGRGPEIKGTRITVYTLIDYLLAAWDPDRIAAFFRLSSDQVQAAIDYIEEHKLEVITNFQKILERSARGNPPELQARLDASHEKFLELVRQIREAKSRGDNEDYIREMIRNYRENGFKGNTNAGDHGRQ